MIALQNIKKSYKMGDQRLEILKGISFEISQGEFVAIMGPSGSGKSTLMNILGLLDTPSEGSFRFNNVEVSHMDEDQLSSLRRNEIGFIFQQFNLLPRISAADNVHLPLVYSQKYLNSNRELDLLELVGLKERVLHKPNELSGGQQQRVAIARSLVNNPRIILADEPTGNLDSQSQEAIMDILKELNANGITVIIVTHEEEVALHANRIIKIRDGLIYSDQKKLDKVESDSKQLLTQQQNVKQKVNSLKNNLDGHLILKLNQMNSKGIVTKNILKNYQYYFVEGFKTLLANKVRTLLSMLGILIGVAAVVAMLALGKGAQQAIEEQLSSLGSNLLMVRTGSVRVGGVTQESGAANRLLYDDLNILKNRISYIKRIAGQVNSRAQVNANSKNWNTYLQGNSNNWAEMHNSVPVLGRFFTEQEDLSRTRVAVIGETVKRELFGENYKKNIIGEMIKINKINFQIIGVLPEKGGNSFRDQDDVVIIPLQTAMKRVLGRDNIEMIEIEIDKPENTDKSVKLTNDLLNEIHKIPISQQSEAFQIRNMAELQKTMQQSSQTLSMLLSAIAAISLLVGGIGIMNIMLVSVTERTKEIGLRKAVGAHKADILFQFLSESVVVSVSGGLLGILFGWIITLIISNAIGWNTYISISSVFLSFTFSGMIGVVFGVYPAKKAANLNPIEALRYE